jgi:hypothetical protein
MFGTLFNDLTVAETLSDRGFDADLQAHDSMAVELIAQFGPQGLGRMRMHGVVAVLHRAQRTVLVARDVVGVDSLFYAQLDGGEVLANSLSVFEDLGMEGNVAARQERRCWGGYPTAVEGVWRVPPGVVAMVTEQALQWQALRPSADTQPFLREIPAEVRSADCDLAGELLGGALRQAWAATCRAHAAPAFDVADNRHQRALLSLVGADSAPPLETAVVAAPSTRWSLLGAASLFEAHPWPQELAALDDKERCQALQQTHQAQASRSPAYPSVGLPEPVVRISERRASQRWLRHTLLFNGLIERAQEHAEQQQHTVVWPHLDPAVLALTGALPETVLAEVATAHRR